MFQSKLNNTLVSNTFDYINTLSRADLSRQDSIDPKQTKNVRYSKPHDICDGQEVHLGNMASGFPHSVLGHLWKSTEYLYLLGEWSLADQESIQRDVLTATSGYAAKRYKKTKHKRQIRADFPSFRLDWMLWCIWQKCLYSEDFRKHLLSFPHDALFVEVVKRDPIWAVEEDESTGLLTGGNGVGKILTICRNCLLTNTQPTIDTELLNRSNIYILGKKVSF